MQSLSLPPLPPRRGSLFTYEIYLLMQFYAPIERKFETNFILYTQVEKGVMKIDFNICMIDYCTQIMGKLKSDARNNFVHLAITRRTGDYIDVDKMISCFSFCIMYTFYI